MITIEFDSTKNKVNYAKHGISFDFALFVLSDLEQVTIADTRQDYGEERFITLGAVRGRVFVVVYTKRGNMYRIISCRKANNREQKTYKIRS